VICNVIQFKSDIIVKSLVVAILAIFLTTSCSILGIIAIGKIFYKKDSKVETATVNIQAKYENVFKVAIETISKNKNAIITQQDKSKGIIKIKTDVGSVASK